MFERYQRDISSTTPEEFIEDMAKDMFKGDVEATGTRILRDYRMGYLGKCALEMPPEYEQEVMSEDSEDWSTGLMEPLPDIE